MRILIDQDGTIADWGRAYGESLDAYGEAAVGIPRHKDQHTFNLEEGCNVRQRLIIRQVMREIGFYERLQTMPGARTALRDMLREGHDVRIVTSPWVENPTCASDKINWVYRRYGKEWANRVILTTDKTLVRGDILIDDKPSVTGDARPLWKHILFDQPYNQDINKPRIDNWSQWRQALEEV